LLGLTYSVCRLGTLVPAGMEMCFTSSLSVYQITVVLHRH